MNEKPSFSIETFPGSRLFTMDIGQLGLKKHHVCALIEMDVTEAREKLRKQKNSDSTPTSFIAWFLKCLAQCIQEHPQFNARLLGKNQRILFNELDISLMVEQEIDGKQVPLPVVLRRVNEKSVTEIHSEIHAAKRQKVKNKGEYVLGNNKNSISTQFALLLPQWLRLMVWKILLKNPIRAKRMMGNVIVSSVGSVRTMRGWSIPVSIHPLSVTLGAIGRRPGICQNQVTIREYLPVTLLMDHDIVDGMPMARFVSSLTQLIEGRRSLPE